MSEGPNWSVWCDSGHQIEDERPDTPIEDRRPCPECGTTARVFSIVVNEEIRTSDTLSVSAVVRPGTIEIQTKAEDPPSPALKGLLEETVALLHLAGRIEVYELLDESPGPTTYRVRVEPDEGEVIEVKGSGEDALLALAEEIDRRANPRPEDLGDGS
jgi:hypothetical protein